MQRANRRYRSSEGGKDRRREQASRYRQRLKRRDASDPTEEREGYHKAVDGKNFCCHRPGCYDRFDVTSRSPQQKYCSAACRQALRRVLVREFRWRERLGLV